MKKLFFLSLFLTVVSCSALADSTPMPGLTNVLIYVDHFLGAGKTAVVGDVISMKRDNLKYTFNGTEFEYSGHYSIMIMTPRKHKNPYFGLGSPETAKLVTLGDFFKDQADATMILPNATIWGKSDGFIDAEAINKEWILSGDYTITN